jgi:hypothetical protein
MIRLFGSESRVCDGFTRRDLLQIGGLGALGLNLDLWMNRKLLRAAEADHAVNFGRAKSCILLFLFGSPPQHETFDPKPEAPAEVQGEMGAILSSVPGLNVCDRLPRTAQVMDRVTVIRSMMHEYPVHGVAYALTGMPTYTPAIEDKPHDPQHWPFMGSVVDWIDRQRTPDLPEIPRNLGLPWVFGSQCDKPTLAGPYAAFLGRAYDPVWTTYEGKPNRVVPKLAVSQGIDVRDHFGGVEPGGRFGLSAANREADVSPRRLELRRSLLEQFESARDWMQKHPGVQTYADQQRAAYSLLMSDRIRNALDVSQEPARVRAEYGQTLFGEASLAARRLVEAGARFVSVFWDPVGPFGASVWDTHANHFPRLKDYLLPVFDQTYPALIRDLDERGLLDETLVLCLSEHGRTPKINNAPGGGRDHWSRAYSAVVAGGGCGRGKVVGRTDRMGSDVESTPVSPKDVLATAFHLLGIDPQSHMPDALNRPLPIAGSGIVRHEFF